MMEVINQVFIGDLKNVNKLCRVCLTESKKMIRLDTEIEQKLEENVSSIWHLLYRVTCIEIPSDKRYPSYICPMCMSLLKMSYKFKLQFELSQKSLEEYFGECITSEPSLKSLIEVIHESHPEIETAPVELISKQGKFDLNDVFIVEALSEEKPNYSGFLKNLGSEVSASFVNEKTKVTAVYNNQSDSVTITSLQEFAQDEFKVQEIQNPFESDDENVNMFVDGNINKNLTSITGTTLTDLNKHKKDINRASKCSVCQKVFATKKYLKLHIERMHLHKRQTFVCEICGAYLKSRSSHYHHMLKHYGKRHTCPHCQKTYFNSSTLQQHILAVHNNARLHLCTICGKSFNYANALDYHMRIHKNEKRYKCSYCEKTFRMQCGLNRHLRIHTGIRPYKCNYCDKAFRSKGELNCHEMIHTGYRPYHCKYCDKGFTKTYNLKMHLLGHSGRHPCEICNKTFIELEYLKIHMRSSHAMKEDSESDKES